MPGLRKPGSGYWQTCTFECRVIEAIGEVYRDIGCPVLLHTELATAAHEVLALLNEHGVLPHRVTLAQVDRYPAAGLHADLASRGAYLGYDGLPELVPHPQLGCLASVVAQNHAGSLLIGGDVA